MGSTCGRTREGSKGTGRTTKCTTKEFLLGLMAEFTEEITSKTRSTATESSVGLMGGGTQGSGQTASSMARVHM